MDNGCGLRASSDERCLHSPEPPQEESVLEPPPFRAASSESQLDIEADIDLPDVTRDHMAAWEPAPEEPERPPLTEASDEPQQSAAPEQLGFDVQDGPEPCGMWARSSASCGSMSTTPLLCGSMCWAAEAVWSATSGL